MDHRLSPLLQVWTTSPSFEGSSPEIPPTDVFLRAQTDPAAISNILSIVHANSEKPDFYMLTEPAAIAIATARVFSASTAAHSKTHMTPTPWEMPRQRHTESF